MEFINHCGVFKAILTGGGWICSGLVANLTRWTLCVFFPIVLETPNNWSDLAKWNCLKKGSKLLKSLESNIQMDSEFLKLSCVCVQTGEATEFSSCCQLESLRSEVEDGAGNLESILAHLLTDSYSGLRFCVKVVGFFLGNWVWSLIPTWRAWSLPLRMIPYW